MSFNLKDYAEVKDRIPIFWQRYPEGRIWTEQVMFDLESGTVEFVCHLFRDHEAEKPIATGWAYEVIGSSSVNRTSAVENCETSAIGRALANLSIHGKTGMEPRPSREEMRKAKPETAEPVAELLNEPIRFGKHRGKTWAEVLDEDRQYVEWAVTNAKKMGADLRATLNDALGGGSPSRQSGANAAESSGDGTTPPSANKGQLAALRAAFGPVMLEVHDQEPDIAKHIEKAINGETNEADVMHWTQWCEGFRA